MSMKKMFKFLVSAAVIAAGFTACSEEVTPIDPINPESPVAPTGEETMATFAFKFNGSSLSTRALDAAPSSENKDVANYRVLLFDAVSGAIELDTVKTVQQGDSLMTAKVLSGQKYLYVIANDGTASSVMGLPIKGAVGTFSANAFNAAFTTGSNTGQNAPDLAGLRTLLGSKFVYASTTKDHSVTLTPGRTISQSQTPGDDNFVDVYLDRAVAKVAITKLGISGPLQSSISPTPPKAIITMDSTGCIDPDIVRYHIWGANAQTYPFQKWNGTTLITPEYVPTKDKDPNTLLHYVRGLGAGTSNNRITIADRSGNPAATDYYYIPENNPQDKRKGNITIAAVEAAFLPLQKFHITNVAYNDASQAFTVTNATTNIASASDFYLFNLDGILGLPQNTVVAGSDAKLVAKKIVFHLNNRTTAEKAALSDYNSLVDDADIGNVSDLSTTLPTDPFTYYKGGLCYYRLIIGEPSGSQIIQTIKRNYYYDATINGFGKLGENSPNKLVEPEDRPEQGETYLSVHIILRDWTGVQITPII